MDDLRQAFVNNLPIIRDNAGLLDSGCCPRPAGIKETHRVPRVPLTRSVSNEEAGEVLQDEAGFPILDEVTARYIFDDLKGT